VLDQLEQQPVASLDDALNYTGVQQYLNSRREVQRKLTAAGVYTLDCTAQELAVRVANSYLEIKGAGVLQSEPSSEGPLYLTGLPLSPHHSSSAYSEL